MSGKIENAREKLLRQGKLSLLESGGNFSIKSLTEECGMATGTFYQYFRSKDELVQQILLLDWDALLASLDPIFVSDRPMREKIEAIYERIEAFEATYHYSPISLFSQTQGNRSFREENLERLYARIKVFLQLEIDRGSLVLTASLDSAAYLLMQLFIATGKNPNMSFDELWRCMTFRDAGI